MMLSNIVTMLDNIMVVSLVLVVCSYLKWKNESEAVTN
jgi:hypothetical protein